MGPSSCYGIKTRVPKSLLKVSIDFFDSGGKSLCRVFSPKDVGCG